MSRLTLPQSLRIWRLPNERDADMPLRGRSGAPWLAPVSHEWRYCVYNFFADVDELPDLARRLELFSFNRFTLFSIDDRKHGPGDGTPIDVIRLVARQRRRQG